MAGQSRRRLGDGRRPAPPHEGVSKRGGSPWWRFRTCALGQPRPGCPLPGALRTAQSADRHAGQGGGRLCRQASLLGVSFHRGLRGTRRPSGRDFTLPLPLGRPRSAVRGDPAARRLPEMPRKRPESARVGLWPLTDIPTCPDPRSAARGPLAGPISPSRSAGSLFLHPVRRGCGEVGH